MRRFLVLALLALLAACGGGGGGGGDGAPSSPAPGPAMHASLAGRYELTMPFGPNIESLNGTVHVHADGTIAGTLGRSFQDAPIPTVGGSDSMQFFGTLGATSAGEITFTYKAYRSRRAADGSWTNENTTQDGTGTVEVSATLVDGAPAIALHFPAADVPFPTRTVTLAQSTLPVAWQGLPAERLSGWYQFSVSSRGFPIMNTDVHIDAVTGAMAGTFGPNCQISGRLFGYDSFSGTFRQEWTFAGTGCPLAGTTQLVGRLGTGANISLEAFGFLAGRWLQVVAHSPVAALPGPFASIAGTYGEGDAILVHPDGTVVAGIQESMFSATVAATGQTYTASGEFANAQQAGTATMTITPTTQDAALALAATIASATMPTPMPSFTAVKVGVADAFYGLPLAKLGGRYGMGAAFTFGEPILLSLVGSEMFIAVDVDPATGAMSGTFGPDCQLSGRLFAYVPSLAMFRQDLSLQGAGCPVTGTGQLLGRLGSNRSGGVVRLLSKGVFMGRPLVFSMTHSQLLGSY